MMAGPQDRPHAAPASTFESARQRRGPQSNEQHARSRLWPRTRGQALVEFALVLPVLLLVVGGALDLGRLFFAYVSVENAAKEGAFFGATNPYCDASKAGCADPSNVTWHATNELSGLTGATVTVTCNGAAVTLSCTPGSTYAVRVSYPFSLITPILTPILGNHLTLATTETSIVLNTAAGPSPSPTATATATATATCQPVPNVVGDQYDAASLAIQAAGLTPLGVQDQGGGNAKGQVTSQSPAPDTVVACGSQVTYHYNKP